MSEDVFILSETSSNVHLHSVSILKLHSVCHVPPSRLLPSRPRQEYRCHPAPVGGAVPALQSAHQIAGSRLYPGGGCAGRCAGRCGSAGAAPLWSTD